MPGLRCSKVTRGEPSRYLPDTLVNDKDKKTAKVHFALQ